MKSVDKNEEASVADMLQNVPLFAGLDKKDLKHIASSFKEKKYGANETIEKEGEKGVSLFLIKDGDVEIKRGNKTLAHLGPGQFFGEMSLLDSQPRSASAIAGGKPATCLVMNTWTWEGFLRTKPEISIALLKELARRLRETDKKLTE
jgi:CRP/FNR family transcriptional regulator, cyclic AMP receptor protein